MSSRIEDRGSRIELRSRAREGGEARGAQAVGGAGDFSILNPESSILYFRTQRGFTLFELVLVIIVVAILMALFASRVIFYQEQAEKTAMIEVENAIQSALTLQYGKILTRGQASDVAALATDNPMDWLQKKPRNYAGAYYDPTPLTVAPGNWMFDLKSRHLIYVPGNTNHFTPGRDGKKWIHFHVAVNYELSRLPSLQNAPAELTGIVFKPVEPYVWF